MLDEKTKLAMKTLSVLYVEDEEDIKSQLVQSFKRKFNKVFTACDGLEGIESYKNNMPDLIVTDIKMPNLDGLAMIEQIREIDTMIPIITVTAYSDVENIKRALELNVDRFIQKPPTKKELDIALYKATLSIIKQKEIEDKDKIIKTILGWEPYFSIITTKDNIEHVTSDFINMLGFNNKEEFLNSMHLMKWKSLNENENVSSLVFENKEELFKTLSSKDEIYRLEVENKKAKKSKEFDVRCRFFENTELYLISLFKI